MGYVSGLFGGGSGASSGQGFTAGSADLLQPVNNQMTNQAYAQSQQGLDYQNQILKALQGQNGIQNQSNVYNQQQALAGQLGDLASGNGPNPALAQLNNSTGQNIQQQAALMASQRGAGANPALIARQAAQQGGALQQQAVGQGAALRAQQQLSGISALQNQQQALGNLASQQVGQQAAATAGYNQAAQAEQQNLLNSTAQFNNANISNMAQQNSANSGIAAGTQKGQQGLFGGLLNAAGSAATGVPSKAYGGEIDKYAQGGPVSAAGKLGYSNTPSNQSSMYQAFAPANNQITNDDSLYNGANSLGNSLAQAFRSSPNGSPTGGLAGGPMDNGMPSNNFQMAANGGAIDYRGGGKVPGKAEVEGDSYANDKVPAMVSPGEIVIPRSISMHANAPELAAKFVADIIKKKGTDYYAEGGEVEESKSPIKGVNININPAPNMTQGPQQIDRSSPTSSFVAKPEGYAEAVNPQMQRAPQGFSLAPSTQSVPSAMNLSATEGNKGEIGKYGTPEEAAPAPIQAEAPQQAPGLEQGVSSQLSQPQGPSSADQYGNSLLEANRQQMEGIGKQAEAEGALGKAQADIYAQQQKASEEQQNHYQQNFAALEDSQKQLTQDIANGHINPTRFIDNMSTGSKIGTAIGMLLSGIGSGLTGQSNMAMDVLNRQIEHDIDSQKADMGNKKTLLEANMQQFGNLHQATQMTRANTMEIMAAKLAQEAAKAQDPLAKARALQLSGALKAQAAGIVQQTALQKTIQQGVQVKTADEASKYVNALVPKESHAGAFKELEKVGQMTKLQNNLELAAKDLEKQALAGSLTPGRRHSDVKTFAGILGRAAEGRYNEDAANAQIEALLPAPFDSKATLEQKRLHREQFFNSQMETPILTGNGINIGKRERYNDQGQRKLQLGPVAQR